MNVVAVLGVSSVPELARVLVTDQITATSAAAAAGAGAANATVLGSMIVVHDRVFGHGIICNGQLVICADVLRSLPYARRKSVQHLVFRPDQLLRDEVLSVMWADDQNKMVTSSSLLNDSPRWYGVTFDRRRGVAEKRGYRFIGRDQDPIPQI